MGEKEELEDKEDRRKEQEYVVRRGSMTERVLFPYHSSDNIHHPNMGHIRKLESFAIYVVCRLPAIGANEPDAKRIHFLNLENHPQIQQKKK